MSQHEIRGGSALWAKVLLLVGLTASCEAPAQERARAGGWQPHIGVHAGSPQGASIALGVMRPLWRASDFSSVGGPRMVLEPGLRAGKLRMGYARSGSFAIGYAVEGAVVREWGRRGRTDLPATGYGVEVHGSGMFVDLGIGVYRRTGGIVRLSVSAGLVL